MLVLASASPRRAEIMRLMGLDFAVCPASAEKNPSPELGPGEYTSESALYKAMDVAPRFGPEDTVIGADTVVEIGGLILGKPAGAGDAFRMLKLLSGRIHRVYTGFALIRGSETVTGHELTEVSFRDLSDAEIREYVATGEPMDKAGAYGIQGRGCVLVSGIAGDYFNVMGFPACRIHTELEALRRRFTDA